MTNFEKLKSEIQKMTVEEFATYCDELVCSDVSMSFCDQYKQCKQCKLEWLKREADE